MKSMALISIVVPVYNCASYLVQCLDSIVAQTFKDYEVFLINDGSVDTSGLICNDYAKRYEKMQVKHSRHEGISVTRNKGIEMATGKYIMFLDPDDWMAPNLLEEMYGKIEGEQVDLILWSFKKKLYNEKNRLLKEEKVQAQNWHLITKAQCKKNLIEIALWDDLLLGVTWNKLYRRELIETYQLRFSKLRKRQDILFNIDYYKHINSIITTSASYSNYRVVEASGGNKVTQNYYEIALYVFKYFREALEAWGQYEGENKVRMEHYFIRNVLGVIKLCMNPKWEWSLKQKYDYIEGIMCQPVVQEVMDEIELTKEKKNLNDRTKWLKYKYLKKGQASKMLMLHMAEAFCGKIKYEQEQEVEVIR